MIGRGIMLAAVVVQTLGGFLPWIRTGHRERTSFQLIDAARTLDVVDSGLQRGLALAWYLVPLVGALCWLAVLLDWRRTAACLAIGAGVLAAGFALSIERAAVPALLGVRTTLVAAVVLVAGGAVELVERRMA